MRRPLRRPHPAGRCFTSEAARRPLVAVVAAVAVLLMSGGGDAEPPGPAPAVVGAPAVAPAPAPGVVAVPAEGTYPGEEPQSPQSVAQAVAALEQIIDRAKQSVIGIRAVTLDGQIQTEFKTREELASITRGFFRRPALRQEVFEAEELYKAIGLMAEDQGPGGHTAGHSASADHGRLRRRQREGLRNQRREQHRAPPKSWG